MTLELTRYDRPGPFTALRADQLPLAADLPADPVALCAAVDGLLVHTADERAADLPPERHAAQQLRPTAAILDALTALDPAPLHVPRPPADRVVGTCRDFATVAVALLRLRGVPARGRAGFATYFQPGRAVDHWIVEYRRDGRWTRVDVELLDPAIPVGACVPVTPEHLAAGRFLTGGEAWARYRAGEVDGGTFGVAGTHNWGPAEIRLNVVRDLAALCRHETLPWDEWGRMTASGQGTTGPDYDALMDRVAEVCAADDPAGITALYATEDFTVPADLLS
jgi:hypothetical protein